MSFVSLTISLSPLVQMPDILDWFGWCTWDAFYTDVTAEGVKEGIKRFLWGDLVSLNLLKIYNIENLDRIITFLLL